LRILLSALALPSDLPASAANMRPAVENAAVNFPLKFLRVMVPEFIVSPYESWNLFHCRRLVNS
jgi:hypothetical protein